MDGESTGFTRVISLDNPEKQFSSVNYINDFLPTVWGSALCIVHWWEKMITQLFCVTLVVSVMIMHELLDTRLCIWRISPLLPYGEINDKTEERESSLILMLHGHGAGAGFRHFDGFKWHKNLTFHFLSRSSTFLYFLL